MGKKDIHQKVLFQKLEFFLNHILTIFTNFLYKQKLSDAHTCYKSFKSNCFEKIELKEKDFAFCPEITAKISKMGIKISEVPIQYKGRSYKEGKKYLYMMDLEQFMFY